MNLGVCRAGADFSLREWGLGVSTFLGRRTWYVHLLLGPLTLWIAQWEA